MRYLSFDMAWKYIQKNPQLMHEVVLEWENAGVQDPAMLGLIARYHAHGGDVAAVLAEYIQSKKRILKTAESKKNHGLRYAAAAVFVGLMALGGWWLKVIWEALKDLQIADTQLATKVGQIEVLVAGQYVKREEMERFANAIFTKLDRIEGKLDSKVDKP